MKPNKYHAQKIISNGTVFDSKREYYFKTLLDQARIPYKMKMVIVLQNKFRYMGEAVKAVKIIPDFIILKNDCTVAIVDTKGMQTEKSKLQIKLLKGLLRNSPIPIYLPTSTGECLEVIEKLRSA